jgi:diguanylate cyclase (GGDEF)-like protein/PAS domain S-box-containing protein
MHGYEIPLILDALITFTLAVIAWTRKNVPGARAFGALMLAVCVWSFAYARELAAIDMARVAFWARTEYFGILAIPIFWIIFTLQFSNHGQYLTRRNLALLVIEPAAILALVWTNDLHRLIWEKVELVRIGSSTVTNYTYGPGFWLNAAYTYLWILIGSLLLIQTAFRTSKVYRGQMIILLVGVAVPWSANLIYLADLSPFPYLDLTPFALAVTGLVVFWGLFRYRFLDILPVARDALVANMSDGLIVLDLNHRIADINPAAIRILNQQPAAVHGKPFEAVFPGDADLLRLFQEESECQFEISLRENGLIRFFDVRTSGLKDSNDQLTGRLIVLRDITDRVEAEKAAQLRANRLALLNDITRISLENESLGEMLEYLAGRLRELLGSDGCYITLWDEDLDKIVPTASNGAFSDVYHNIRIEPGEATLSESVVKAGHCLIVHDVSSSPYISPRIAALFPFNSLIGFPLIAGEERFGAVLIAFTQPHQFSEEEIDLGEQATAQIALAIAKTRLLEAERKRVDELEALRANVTDISGVREIPALLGAILERAITMLKASGGDIGLYNDQQKTITILLSHNLGKDHAGMTMALGEGAMGAAVERGSPVVIENYQTWENRSPKFQNQEWRAAIATPLRFRDQIVGALGIVDVDPRRKFSLDDMQLLDLFAQQAAIAVENARLYAAEKQRAEELSVLYEASTKISRSIDHTAVANIAAEEMARSVHATSAHIYNCDLDEGTATLIAEYFGPGANEQERVSDLYTKYDLTKYPKTLAALRQGNIFAIRAGDQDLDPEDSAELVKYRIKSTLNVPMIASGKVLGFAEIWDSTTEREWEAEDLRICQTLANQTAVTLDNARLYSEMQHMAITDPLTGVYNRRGLFEAGEREIQRAIRTDRPLSGIMIDIDHFKKVNDTYSHAVGDQVLQGMIELCKKQLRSTDILGRYGGEEFAILLPETDCQIAYRIAERIRQSIAETPIRTKEGEISITISMGITCTREGISDVGIFLDRADTAMYTAKTLGRNRVVAPSQEPGLLEPAAYAEKFVP